MPELPPLLFLATLVVVGVTAAAVRFKLFRKMQRQAGRRPDGSYPEGRRFRDMSLPTQVAMVIAVVAFGVFSVLRVVAEDSPATWWAIGIALAASVVGVVLEKRRTRRLGLESLG